MNRTLHRARFAVALLVAALGLVTTAAHADPVKLLHSSANYTIILDGDVTGSTFTAGKVGAYRPDGSIARGGPCNGLRGDRCGEALSESFNHVYGSNAAPVTMVSSDGAVTMFCLRSEVGGLTGVVNSCEASFVFAEADGDTACDEPGWGNLSSCVGNAWSAAHRDELLWERYWDALPLERWIRWLTSYCMYPTDLMPLS